MTEQALRLTVSRRGPVILLTNRSLPLRWEFYFKLGL